VIVRSRICRSEGMTSALGSPFGQSGTESIDCPCPPYSFPPRFPVSRYPRPELLRINLWRPGLPRHQIACSTTSKQAWSTDGITVSVEDPGRESDNPGHELPTPATPWPCPQALHASIAVLGTELLLLSKGRMTLRVGSIFWFISYTMICQPKGLGLHIYSWPMQAFPFV
jgi:hypothetical protein